MEGIEDPKKSLEGLQSVYIVDQNKHIVSGEDALEQLVQKVPIIPTHGAGLAVAGNVKNSLPDGTEAGGRPVYILTPPHQCSCGSSDCTPELNQSKLRQILALKRLLESGQDVDTFLQRTSDRLRQEDCENETPTNDGEDDGESNVCGEEIKTEDALGPESELSKNKKAKKNKVEKRYQCGDCRKRFCSQDAFEKHSKRHNGQKPYKCKVCMKTFHASKVLKKHVKEEHDWSHQETIGPKDESEIERKHKCNICNKSFKKVNNYVLHMVLHNDNRPHSCDKCGKTFKMSGNLSVHRKYCGKPQQIHQCQFCEREFKGQSQCVEHERTHTNERPYQCRFCSKRFKTRQHEKNHERVHTGETPYECKDCGKRFRLATTFATHKRQHDAKFPHICEHCGKGFQIRRQLEEHNRTHTGERPFSCPQCEKTFALKRTLVVHLRSHTGYRPWVCDHCGKQFATSGRLKEHTRIHTGEKPFACTQCPKRFVQWQQLKSHKKTHQKIPEIIEALESAAVRQLAASLSSSLSSPVSDQSLTVAQLHTTVQDTNGVSVTTCEQIEIIQAVQEQDNANVEAQELVLQTGPDHSQSTQQEICAIEQTDSDQTHQLTQDAIEVACAIEGLNSECEAIAAGSAFPTEGESIQIVLSCEGSDGTLYVDGDLGTNVDEQSSSTLFQ